MAAASPEEQPPSSSRGLSPTIKKLGVVSLLADVSSEMVYPLNPIFLTRVLGAPPWALGLIEGIAESTASLLKLVSGWLSDRAGRRKPYAVVGYGLGALGKPLIAVATSWAHVLVARFVDRLGKGLRTAPRDALIADNCPVAHRGRAFGYHRAMDTLGAVAGPLLGYWLVSSVLKGSEGQRFTALYWLAFVPGILATLVLAIGVRERAQRPVTPENRLLPSLRGLSPRMRNYLWIVALFSLGNSSDSFLILKAQQDMGIRPEHVLLLYATFNIVEAVMGYPAGLLADRAGKRLLVAAGWGVFCVVYLGFALLKGPVAAFALFVLYGAYYTLTQGAQRALAADLAHPARRATEIGAFHMVVGVAALPASQMAGVLYGFDRRLPFLVGAVTAGLAALAIMVTLLDRKPETLVD